MYPSPIVTAVAGPLAAGFAAADPDAPAEAAGLAAAEATVLGAAEAALGLAAATDGAADAGEGGGAVAAGLAGAASPQALASTPKPNASNARCRCFMVRVCLRQLCSSPRLRQARARRSIKVINENTVTPNTTRQ